jgi:hypothetical protein
MTRWVAVFKSKGIDMFQFRWFHILLGVNFFTSISIILFIWLLGDNPNASYYVLPMYLIWIALMMGSILPLLLITIGHFKNALTLLKNGDGNGLRLGMKRMKLASIPYFILNFLYFTVLALIGFAASKGLIIFTPIPLVFVLVIFLTYVVMLLTSTYGFVYLFYLKKTEGMKTVPFIVHFIMQLIFVLDIIDTVLVLSWYPNDGKHGWKRTAITIGIILTIIALGVGLIWHNITYVASDRNMDNYPSQDTAFAQMASLRMPELSSFPQDAQLHFENKKHQVGFSYWQSTLLTAAYHQSTYQMEKANLDQKYDFLSDSNQKNEAYYTIPVAEFSVKGYDFRVIDPPGDEFDNFPSEIGMIATSDEEKTIVYLYCYDQNLYTMGEGVATDVMIQYVNEKYDHFWE